MRRLLFCLLSLFLLTGCTTEPALPKDASPAPDTALPQLSVWVTEANALMQMDVESYVAGVVAGEIPNDWPMEALKAQAILARTFVMKFITEKESRYPGADISTDIAEAQAYDAAAVNSNILEAVHSTQGEILMTEDGQLPYTWFHAHSGGSTALARESLDWQHAEPTHTRVTDGLDSPKAPASAKEWEAFFSMDEFLAACREAGYAVTTRDEIRIAETGSSGRAVTLEVDGVTVSAARLRISLGSTRMRSTLLTELTVSEEGVFMAGQGYGHGVGMPQWGAYALAEAGWSAKEIALHYYTGLKLVRAW